MLKIVTRALGGLGNQLFAYAAARRLALKNNAELILDDVSGFVRDAAYQRHYQLDHFNIPCRKATPGERLEPLSRLRRYLKKSMNHRLPFEERNYIQQEGVDFDPRLLAVKPRGTVYLEGYWQSEGYFKDVEEAIRDDLRIKPPTDPENRNMASRIQSTPSVAVHVRFFDAPDQRGSSSPMGDYYHHALAQMEQQHPGAHYFLFSDRPDAARAVVSLPDDRITCVSHNTGDTTAYADLWLMTLCQNFIVANSTFSWWGAWLGAHHDKTVIAPGLEQRQGSAWWGFDGLIPEGWIKC